MCQRPAIFRGVEGSVGRCICGFRHSARRFDATFIGLVTCFREMAGLAMCVNRGGVGVKVRLWRCVKVARISPSVPNHRCDFGPRVARKVSCFGPVLMIGNGRPGR